MRKTICCNDFIYVFMMTKRTGPHPLSVHLGMAAANAVSTRAYASFFDQGVDDEKMVAMMRGIKLYQNAKYRTKRNEMQPVWSRGSVRLLQRNAMAGHIQAPLIIIPSLVNRSYIFNLNTQRSFVDWVSENNISVYLLDWGEIADGDEATIGNIIFDIIPSVIKYVSAQHKDVKPHVLGYCIGGALTLGAVQSMTSDVGKIVLLASPWDFHHKKLELSNRVRSWSPFALNAISEKGYLPEQWVQALFASLDPDATVHKFIKFAEMDHNTDEARLFIDVEDWLNDNVKMSAEIAKHCLQNWFAGNVFIKNQWYVNGRHIDFTAIRNEVLVIASKRDRLVPYDSAIEVIKTLKHAQCEIKETDCGHIGFIAGKGAIKSVWRPLLEWFQKK